MIEYAGVQHRAGDNIRRRMQPAAGRPGCAPVRPAATRRWHLSQHLPPDPCHLRASAESPQCRRLRHWYVLTDPGYFAMDECSPCPAPERVSVAFCAHVLASWLREQCCCASRVQQLCVNCLLYMLVILSCPISKRRDSGASFPVMKGGGCNWNAPDLCLTLCCNALCRSAAYVAAVRVHGQARGRAAAGAHALAQGAASRPVRGAQCAAAAAPHKRPCSQTGCLFSGFSLASPLSCIRHSL